MIESWPIKLPDRLPTRQFMMPNHSVWISREPTIEIMHVKSLFTNSVLEEPSWEELKFVYAGSDSLFKLEVLNYILETEKEKLKPRALKLALFFEACFIRVVEEKIQRVLHKIGVKNEIRENNRSLLLSGQPSCSL